MTVSAASDIAQARNAGKQRRCAHVVLGWEGGWSVLRQTDRQAKRENPEALGEQIHVSHPYSGLCNGKQKMNSPNEKRVILSA